MDEWWMSEMIQKPSVLRLFVYQDVIFTQRWTISLIQHLVVADTFFSFGLDITSQQHWLICYLDYSFLLQTLTLGLTHLLVTHTVPKNIRLKLTVKLEGKKDSEYRCQHLIAMFSHYHWINNLITVTTNVYFYKLSKKSNCCRAFVLNCTSLNEFLLLYPPAEVSNRIWLINKRKAEFVENENLIPLIESSAGFGSTAHSHFNHTP